MNVQIVEVAKRHWVAIAGGLVGLFVLYYLAKQLSAGGGGSDLSGGAATVTGLSAAASLQNAQLNAQTANASLQASVAQNGIQAQLQSDLAKTAAELAAQQQATAATTAVSLGAQSTAVSIQQIQSDQAIKETAIKGQTYEDITATQAQSQVLINASHDALLKTSIEGIQSQIADVLSKGNRQTTLTALSPIIAAELGEQAASAAASQGNATVQSVHSPAGLLNGVAEAGSAILTGLFA